MAETSPIIDYTSKDYAAFRADMLAFASNVLPEWTSRSPADFGVVLVELFAYMGDILSFYGDRVANEAYLQTATQRSSVLAIARMLDYRPNGASAASVQLTFTAAPGAGEVTVPAGTRISTLTLGAEPIYFETTDDLVIPGDAAVPPVIVGTVKAVEGVTILEDVAISSGFMSQEYILTQSPVIENSLDIGVDEGAGNVYWTWTEHLVEHGPADQVYTTYTDEFNLVHVVFGDGVNGKVPSAQSPIIAGYRVGGGSIGNVGPGTLTMLDSYIQGVLTVTNTAAATGGQDAETLDQIRVNAPASLLSLNRAVTLQDYEALAVKVPGIAKAKARSLVYTSVQLFVAPLGGGLDADDSPIIVHETRKAALRTYLADKIPATVTVTLADPAYVKIDIAVTLVVAPQYIQKTIEAAVLKALTGQLTFDNVGFEQRVTLGQVYSTINSVLGVGYGTVTVLDREGGLGAADIQLAPHEIPVPGEITLLTSGGIVA